MHWKPGILCFILCWGGLSAHAAVPEAMHFSGTLDTGGTALTGDISIRFTLYTDPTSTAPDSTLWTATETVAVDDGRFQSVLSGVTQTMLAGGVLHLGIQVETDPEMSPRIAVLSVPFARQADNARTVGGQAASAFAASSHTHPLSALDHANCDAGHVLTSDGSAWTCGAPPVLVEDDPKVSLDTTNAVPKWNGAALVAGSITDNGNIGIGTDAPINKLEIHGSGNEFLRIVAGGTGYSAAGLKLETTSSLNRPSGVYMYNSVAKNTWYMGRQYNVDVWGVGRTEETDTLDTSAADKSNAFLSVTGQGRVGIGLTSPSDELHVKSTHPTLRLDETGVRAWRLSAGEYNSGNFSIADSTAGARLVIDGSGNVGIGTKTPSRPLHVQGDVQVDGRIRSSCNTRLQMYQNICYAHAVQNQWSQVAAVSATMTSQDDNSGDDVCKNYVGNNGETHWNCHTMPFVYPANAGGDIRPSWQNCGDPASMGSYTWFNPEDCTGLVMVCCYK